MCPIRSTRDSGKHASIWLLESLQVTLHMNPAILLEPQHHDKAEISDKGENQGGLPALKAHELQCEHGKNSESHQVCCYDQHSKPPELELVTKVVTKKFADDSVVAIKTLHIVIPVAKLIDSKTI